MEAQILVEQYLKASAKLKKIDQAVFKRFAPNVAKILEEFTRLAAIFKDTAVHSYAAMCYLGIAKCEKYVGNAVCECQAYLKAARSFLQANNKEGAICSFNNALSSCADDSVMKACIIREMCQQQPHYTGETSNFASLPHRIYELEEHAKLQLKNENYYGCLQNLDDIIDTINELKRQHLYEELLRRIELWQLLLLVKLNLPPARQSPSHIKLIEYYYNLGNFEISPNDATFPSARISQALKFQLADLVVTWLEGNTEAVKLILQQLYTDYILDTPHKFVIKNNLNDIERSH